MGWTAMWCGMEGKWGCGEGASGDEEMCLQGSFWEGAGLCKVPVLEHELSSPRHWCFMGSSHWCLAISVHWAQSTWGSQEMCSRVNGDVKKGVHSFWGQNGGDVRIELWERSASQTNLLWFVKLVHLSDEIQEACQRGDFLHSTTPPDSS